MPDRNRNAKVIVPLAVAAWLGGILVFREGVPEVARIAYVVAFVVAVPVVVFALMAEAGWGALARRYRAAEPFAGAWRPYPTAVVSRVSVQDPDFRSHQLRFFGGSLRVGTSTEALHLSTLFTRLPLLAGLFPEVRIPWSAVTSARTYAAPGWYAPQREPGALVQAAYDPNYTGTFVEIAAGDPAVYLQLPTDLLGPDAMARLPAGG